MKSPKQNKKQKQKFQQEKKFEISNSTWTKNRKAMKKVVEREGLHSSVYAFLANKSVPSVLESTWRSSIRFPGKTYEPSHGEST